MRKKGRPIEGDEKMRPVLVKMDSQTKARAEEIGGGNVSAGVRKALKAYRTKPTKPADSVEI